jgi:hypothetical protein
MIKMKWRVGSVFQMTSQVFARQTFPFFVCLPLEGRPAIYSESGNKQGLNAYLECVQAHAVGIKVKPGFKLTSGDGSNGRLARQLNVEHAMPTHALPIFAYKKA